MTFARAFLEDLVKLRLPVTAGAVLATALALVQPFGIGLGGDTTAKVTAALVALGVVAQYLQDKLRAPQRGGRPGRHTDGGVVTAPSPAQGEHALAVQPSSDDEVNA
ncbi:hypothetical protein [Conexibacter woesei]|uniref:Holin n=1 Tax=Conexibacter woesei (strain DSM 14684 / CCUG 47730 / CIP 108061 / JCM 11494 / NBRC 100937 / ID131577) TaxID=469383 RepID=D3F185_CONWI|nr:hypothetical protein [Conexibacter woesei]ADB50161.1 hypothetical protein Cwoe_1734 [Conexibacter woesei DSM 14684]